MAGSMGFCDESLDQAPPHALTLQFRRQLDLVDQPVGTAAIQFQHADHAAVALENVGIADAFQHTCQQRGRGRIGARRAQVIGQHGFAQGDQRRHVGGHRLASAHAIGQGRARRRGRHHRAQHPADAAGVDFQRGGTHRFGGHVLVEADAEMQLALGRARGMDGGQVDAMAFEHLQQVAQRTGAVQRQVDADRARLGEVGQQVADALVGVIALVQRLLVETLPRSAEETLAEARPCRFVAGSDELLQGGEFIHQPCQHVGRVRVLELDILVDRRVHRQDARDHAGVLLERG